MGVSGHCTLLPCSLPALGPHTVPRFGMEAGWTPNKLPSPQEGQEVIPHQPFPPRLSAAKPKSQQLQWSRGAHKCGKVSSTHGTDLAWCNSTCPSALPRTSPPPGHSRALHSSDAMALPPPRWRSLGRKEREQLGEGGSDPPSAPVSCRVGSGHAHACARCVCPCPCASAPAPGSCWVIAFRKCRVHPAVPMKY